MKLSQKTIEFLSRVLKVAKILKVENIILDNECVRGHLQEEGSMIIHRDNLDFEFSSLGITRINTLDTRLSLLKNNFEIEAEEKEKTSAEKVIYKLLLSDDKTEIEFKCSDPAVLQKAPKLIKDPVFFSFKISEETIALLSKAKSAMAGATVSLVGSNTGIIAKLSDVDGDMLNHIVSEELQYSEEADKRKFYFSYKIDVLIKLLKESLTDGFTNINITKRGFLITTPLGIKTYITAEL